MANIVQLKLSTQEWVVGELQQTLEPTATLTIKQPLMILLVPQGPQNYSLQLAPFNPADPEGTVKIHKSAIVSEPVEIAKSLHDAYVRHTSNIEVVSSLEGLK